MKQPITIKLENSHEEIIWHRCREGSCLRIFDDQGQRSLHEVMDWHCAVCGASSGSEITLDNQNLLCYICEEKKHDNQS